MKKHQILILALVAIILGFFAITIAYVNSSIISVKSFNATLRVSDYVGINIDTDKIHFGTVPGNGTARRELILNSTEPGYLIVKVKGPLEDSISVQNSNLQVSRGENHVLLVAVPGNLGTGYYESEVNFYVVRYKTVFHDWYLPGKIVPDYRIPVSPGGLVGITIVNSTQNNVSD